MRRFAVLVVFALGGTSAWALDPVSNETLTQRVLKQRARHIDLIKKPFRFYFAKSDENKSQLSLFTTTEPSPIASPRLFVTDSSSKTCAVRPLDTKINPRAAVRKTKAPATLLFTQSTPEPELACPK